MTSKRLGLAIFLLVILAGTLWKKGPAPVSEPLAPVSSQEVSAAAPRPSPAAFSPSSTASNSSRPPTASPSLERALLGFQGLAEKPFLTEAEKEWKHQLLKNPTLISEVQAALLHPESLTSVSAQNAAVDVLLETLRSGDEAAGLRAITEILRDPQIENTQLPLAQRQTLAGIKAELLYHATALKPEAFSNVGSWLPGPVSQKIWQNVQEQQADNLSESQAEIQAHQAQWGGAGL